MFFFISITFEVGPLKLFWGISDCKNHLLKPDHKLMKTSTSLLQNVAMASGMTSEVVHMYMNIFTWEIKADR